MWLSLISVVLMGAIAAYVYKLFFSSSKDIFKEYGIREIDTSVVGSKLDFIFGRKGAPEADAYAYNLMGSEKYCGISDMMSQMILIKDMELIKKVLIKDFDHFVDRRDFFEIENAVVRKMLPSLKGEEWKKIRQSVSPTFTTGKIRRMMEIFNSVGKEWVESFTGKARESSNGSVTINALQCVNQCSIDCIASAVFGLSPGTIKDENSMFAKYATRLTDFTKWKLIKMILCVGFPKFAKIFNLSFFDEEAVAFFTSILDQGFKARISGTTAKRNDFLQLLVEAKKGELKAEGKDELSKFEKDAQLETGGEKKQWLTEQIMCSQSFVFFFAGFSTTSNTITFAAFILAMHQEIQDKLRNEVDSMLFQDASDKEIDYDKLNGLVYLDMVVCEVLRKFPVGARLERKCIRDYKDNESGLFVPKDTIVIIPVHGIHNDKQYYENPERFNPENFSPEKKRNPYAYMPFGIGPRNCIGMRFAMVETKSAIAHLVHNFRIEPTKKTSVITGVWVGFGYTVPKDLELKLTPIHN